MLKKINFLQFFAYSFIHCFFISLLTMSLTSRLFFKIGIPFELLSIANVLMTLMITMSLFGLFHKRRYFKIYNKINLKYLFLVSVITGLLSFFIAVYHLTIFFVAILITTFTFRNIKSFASRMGHLLDFNKIATTTDLIEFLDFFVNLILTFTVLNIALYVASYNLKEEVAFNFSVNLGAIIDSLYFTVITMTTVGYGDITPQSEIAKILMAFECIISYVMFGLMIGIISRGIDFSKKDINNPNKKN